MTDAQWRFTGLEFETLWNDLVAQRKSAGLALERRIDDTLRHALVTLDEPEARIDGCGFGGPGLSRNAVYTPVYSEVRQHCWCSGPATLSANRCSRAASREWTSSYSPDM